MLRGCFGVLVGRDGMLRGCFGVLVGRDGLWRRESSGKCGAVEVILLFRTLT